MRKIVSIILFATLSISMWAVESDTTKVWKEEKPITKTGYNFGPFPVVAFDADRGFGMGALLNIFDFGDGSTYPNPRQQWYIEASYYTKKTQIYVVNYDAQGLIPGIRFSATAQCLIDNALPFVGFNGYETFYDHDRMVEGKKNDSVRMYNPYYRTDRLQAFFRADFTGNITQNRRFKWVAGYNFKYNRYRDMNIDVFNKNLDENKKYLVNDPTLFGQYKEWGIIPEELHDGGITSALRAGLVYDSRDVENNATRGIWAEGHVIASPKWLGSTVSDYRYSLNFRHYIPIVAKKLTFAYRLTYQGTMGNETPFYNMPYYTVMGKGYDRDGIGGYQTIRGMMRNRLQGLDVGYYNAEFRYRFVDFKLWKQNIAFALNVFTDGGIVTRGYDMSFKAKESDFASVDEYNKSQAAYDSYMKQGNGLGHDTLHMTAGGGIRFIMNENFILAAEYGVPFNKQDGAPSFYLNTGYLF